jgi:hypothetical protein
MMDVSESGPVSTSCGSMAERVEFIHLARIILRCSPHQEKEKGLPRTKVGGFAELDADKMTG